MKKIEFEIKIQATPWKVWQVLWFDGTYRKWTSVFSEGSRAISDWKEGSTILFVNEEGAGMFSKISESKENAVMRFTHLGMAKDFKQQEPDAETASWAGAEECYVLTASGEHTLLKVTMDIVEEHESYFQEAFPKALAIVKELSENPVQIEVKTEVKTSVEKAWDTFTNPQYITKWCFASDDWHAPRATNDLRVGGSFTTRMESKDGQMGFDFGGVYSAVDLYKNIEYAMEDGRKVKVSFASNGNATLVSEVFDAESTHPFSLQEGGWQAILENYKKIAETH